MLVPCSIKTKDFFVCASCVASENMILPAITTVAERAQQRAIEEYRLHLISCSSQQNARSILGERKAQHGCTGVQYLCRGWHKPNARQTQHGRYPVRTGGLALWRHWSAENYFSAGAGWQFKSVVACMWELLPKIV